MQSRKLIQLCLLTLVTVPVLAHSQVLWERYAGSAYNTHEEGTLSAAQYDNMSETRLDGLLALAADHSNAVDTGTAPQFDWPTTANQLCEYANETRTPACELGALGQVSYAIIRFPQAGTYQITTLNDDRVRLDTSTELGSAAYRQAAYTTAGQIDAWSDSPQNLAPVTSTQPNSCLLVRVAWSNNNGLNKLIAQWEGPGIASPEVIPASHIHDPRSQPAACAEQVVVVPTTATPVPTTSFYALTLLALLLAAATACMRRKKSQ